MCHVMHYDGYRCQMPPPLAMALYNVVVIEVWNYGAIDVEAHHCRVLLSCRQTTGCRVVFKQD